MHIPILYKLGSSSPSIAHPAAKMVPSNKLILIALLVAAAVVSPSLQPSSALRIPCIPGLPRIPFLPCSPPPPLPELPTECWTPLTKMVPCAGFITNGGGLQAPSTACCEGFESIGHHAQAVCYCRVANGDVGQLFAAPLNVTRLFSLPKACDVHLRMEGLLKYCPSKSHELLLTISRLHHAIKSNYLYISMNIVYIKQWMMCRRWYVRLVLHHHHRVYFSKKIFGDSYINIIIKLVFIKHQHHLLFLCRKTVRRRLIKEEQ